ncbi:MAG TPA: CPBP family intramembrane glutamic endopeptidase [Bryobacteraceae bacterium]|nr:CPBP family intramembrane glutamic endopeptidase [Bryobacteraceae bacterium]
MASLRPIGLVSVALTLLLLIAGIAYANLQHIPMTAAGPVLVALILEVLLYHAAGTVEIRTKLEQLPPALLAALMTVTAGVPYLIYAVPTGLYSTQRFATLLLLALMASFWYVVLPRRAIFDILYLVFLGAIYITKSFHALYPEPWDHTYASVLGTLMWIRTGMLAVLSLRKMTGIGFGFVPRSEDWSVGFRNYLYFLPGGIGLGLALNFLRPDPVPLDLRTIGLALLTFLVTLWVLAAMEEVFFRGILQQIVTKASGSPVAGLLTASVLFGLVHLPYRSFPNWHFAALATVAGFFYGRAFTQAQSVRASMVTHALVVTTWRVFLA